MNRASSRKYGIECCPVVKSVHYLEALQTNVKFISTLKQRSIKRKLGIYSLSFLVTMRVVLF